MTVSNQKRSIRYQGNDAATEFDYDFFIEEASHVEVIIYNSTAETYTTLTGEQYSITGLNDPGFGAVTYPLVGDPLSTNEYIIINRVAPYIQVMDIPPQGGFYPDVIEAAMDRTTRQIQQIAEIQSRSLFVVEGETFQKRLPLRSLLGDRVLAFDENGDPIAGPTAAEIGNAQGYAEDASAAKTAAETAQAAAETALSATLAVVPNAFPATRTILKGYDTATITAAYLREARREGQFLWNSADLSGTLITATGLSTAVDATLDIVTKAAHGLLNGDAVYPTAAVNGLTAEMFYYVIGLRSIDYDAESAAFTVGETLTGGTSGATGVIVKVTDAGATGTLLLKTVTGAFIDNETITDGSGGSATADGADTLATDDFMLASSYANAIAGTAVDLTGTTNFTVKRHLDPAEGIYVVATGDAIDGSQGAWVRSAGSAIPVEWFGAKGDDATDDTTAINAAFAYAGAVGGGEILFGPKTYKITAPINVASSSVAWRGESRSGSLIKQYTLSAKVFNVTGALGCGGRKFSTIYAGTPTAGATALHVDSGYFFATDFMLRNSHTGIDVTNSSGPKFTDFEILDYESAGLHAHSINDVYVNNFIMNAGNTTRGALGGIRLSEQVEAFICSNGDILLGVYSLTTDATSYTVGNRPAYNNFSNVYFDSAASGCAVTKLIETEFVGCWFSGGRTNTTAGMTLSGQTDSLTFVACRFFNNGSHGFYASNQAARTKLIGCKFQSNSITAGSGVAHGAYFDGTAGFNVVACSSGNDLYSGQQGYGVYVGAGCSGFTIRDGDMTGNVTGAISDNSGAVGKHIAGVLGYVTQNKGAGTIAVGQTVTVITHGLSATPTAADISIAFASSPPASGVASIYVTSIGPTTFQIATNTAVTSTNLSVAWQARIAGA